MPTKPPDLAEWPAGPDRPTLAPGEVHVWLAPLAPDAARRRQLEGHLSKSERERASRFRFEDDATRFTIGRALLRVLLGRYTGTAPPRIELEETQHGRPYRVQPTSLAGLDFNLSHSRDLALFAFCLDARVGIDIEWSQPLNDMDDLVEINFSEHERATYRALPDAGRQDAFFDCWTRKEAFVKAIGEGLSHPLDAFDVAFGPGRAPAFLRLASTPGELPRWSLHALEPGPGYAASLAVDLPSPTVHRFRVPADAA